MTRQALTLLADTNLFFECKKLEDLPWSDLHADPVTILVTRPVLNEIDKHKKSSGRTRNRAIEVYGRIRRMLKNQQQRVVIQDSGPRVIFERAANLRFDPALRGELDQSKNDDHLIGLLSSAIKNAPGQSICLFTHDTGPADTASDLGLPFRLIEDDWLRPKRQSNANKELDDLKQDIAAYRDQEPQINIGLEDYNDPKGPVLLVRKTAPALTDAQIDSLIADIHDRCPMQTDFTSQGTNRVDLGAKILGQTVSYEPVPEEDIATYQTETYPNWLDACRKALETLHEHLCVPTGYETLRYVMDNAGSRPAEQIRVSFRADGDIYFIRYSEEDQERREEVNEKTDLEKPNPSLPLKPRAPQQRRVVTKRPSATETTLGSLRGTDIGGLTGMAGILDSTSGIGRIIAQQEKMAKIFGQNNALAAIQQPHAMFHENLSIQALHTFREPKHDPEAFYYDEWPSASPVDDGALTSDLWRHHIAPQHFTFDIHADVDKLKGGSICIELHAQNLTRPKTLRTKVVIEETIVDTLEEAKRLMSRLQ